MITILQEDLSKFPKTSIADKDYMEFRKWLAGKIEINDREINRIIKHANEMGIDYEGIKLRIEKSMIGNKNIESPASYLMSLLNEEYKEPKNKSAKSKFNNYERAENVDYDALLNQMNEKE
jgi:hypothetical protein